LLAFSLLPAGLRVEGVIFLDPPLRGDVAMTSTLTCSN